ncbi:MAG: hypothetical protein KDD48_03510 [Bdellovibrionales bacterium]|nr:hypothetical protein [Bdellovibrionales bacterium]
MNISLRKSAIIVSFIFSYWSGISYSCDFNAFRKHLDPVNGNLFIDGKALAERILFEVHTRNIV